MDGQSQTRRRRCHYWELPRWTVGLLQTNWYRMRGSSQRGLQHAFDRFSDACDQAGTKISSKKLRYCVFQDTQGSVFCKRVAIYCSGWRRSSTWRLYSRVTEVGTKIGKANAVLNELYCSVVTKWKLSKTASFHFLIRSLFRSSPVIMNHRWRLKEYCQKNKSRDRLFAKSSRCETSWQRAQVWNP